MQPITPSPRTLPPTVLTIFGMSGNLTQIKLLPALYHLLAQGMLPAEFAVLGIFRTSSKDIDHVMQQVEINLLRSHLNVDPTILAQLRSLIHPVMLDSTDQAEYHVLREALDELDRAKGIKHNRLFYLAIPPTIFGQVMRCLQGAGLHQETADSTSRILVEKPFGTDLASATELVNMMTAIFKEEQIYRIDHYLAKENAQNILTFRFSNPLIENMWGRHAIDHIQITAAESIGIDSRSNFYEGMGALRDFVQSHLMQLTALVMMERPESLTSEAIHAEKLALLEAVQPIQAAHVEERAVRGQYATYRSEVNNPNSTTETYAAVALEVTNSRWGGVPVILRTGKALDKQRTEIKVVFKDRSNRHVPPNVLTIRIQPDEGIAISLTAKRPGFSDELQPVNMRFSYQESFDKNAPDAYERVLVDAIAGDQSLFASSQEVLRCWEIVEPIIQNWNQHPEQPTVYQQGSRGPVEADTLAESFGSEWL